MIEPWLHGDPIAHRLILMGWHSTDAYSVSERCAIIAEGDKIDIYEAAVRCIGFYPHSADVQERKAMT